MFKNHPGMDRRRAPSDISRPEDQTGGSPAGYKGRGVGEGRQARATAERDAASEGGAGPGHGSIAPARAMSSKRAFQAADTAGKGSSIRLTCWGAAIGTELDTRRELAGATSARETLSAEFKKADIPELRGTWAWIASLRELRQALTAPDLKPAAGMEAFERLTTGDLTELGSDARADNPPLLRLLEVGFFNPKGAFDLAFFEEMAHSGFWPGATWNFGGADSMHFELVEGRHSIKEPGKKS